MIYRDGFKICGGSAGRLHTAEDENGQWRGGANIYLAKIWKPLGWIWAVSCCFGMGIGCGVHTGAITSSVATFGVQPMITTIICCVIIIAVLLGGLGALVKVTDKLVPTMAFIYMAAGAILIILNIQNFVPAFVSIFTNAFTGTAATWRICRSGALSYD